MDRLGGLLHDLEGGAVAVRSRVGGIRELLRHEDAWILLRHALRDGGTFGDGRADVAGVVHENDLRPVVAHELAALLAHAVRHHDDGLVSLDRADEGETDALVAACRLHDDGVRLEPPALFGVSDHVEGGARLDGAAHVERLELHQHLGHVGCDHAVQAHKRGVPYRVKYCVADHIGSLKCGEFYQVLQFCASRGCVWRARSMRSPAVALPLDSGGRFWYN